LSNVCRELEVELIRDWNISLDYSWGKVGHYTIGTFAVTAVENLVVADPSNTLTKFKKLVANNLDNISLPEGRVASANFEATLRRIRESLQLAMS
jgi:hypothetical protein